MAVTNITSNSSTSSTKGSNSLTGFAALTSQDFMKMLLAELKNQDPTSPVKNSDLLAQLSQMQSLQSNVELKSTLTNFASNEQIASGASFLGKVITGVDANKKPVSGVASSVFTQNGNLMIGVGSNAVSLSDVTGVALP